MDMKVKEESLADRRARQLGAATAKEMAARQACSEAIDAVRPHVAVLKDLIKNGQSHATIMEAPAWSPLYTLVQAVCARQYLLAHLSHDPRKDIAYNATSILAHAVPTDKRPALAHYFEQEAKPRNNGLGKNPYGWTADVAARATLMPAFGMISDDLGIDHPNAPKFWAQCIADMFDPQCSVDWNARAQTYLQSLQPGGEAVQRALALA